MKLLTVTNLYPGKDRPRHGIFVEERLRHLVADGLLEAEVIALRPGVRKSPWTETRHSIEVRYLPVPTLPFITNWIDPLLWANTLEPVIARLIEKTQGGAVLDGHFLYPDGAAVALIGKRLGIPVVLTARGSDVNVKCNNSVVKKWVKWSLGASYALITVSNALATRVSELKIAPETMQVIANGVDLEKFRPYEKNMAKKRFGLSGRVIASVGHLVRNKGHRYAIEALRALSDSTLLIVGEGPEERNLRGMARDLGLIERIRFVGLVKPEEMPLVYSAADALVLLSENEGMPNVILESMACGTPVVATNVGGVAEVVRCSEAGVIIEERSAAALVEGLQLLFSRSRSSNETRVFASQFSWDRIIGAQIELYSKALLPENKDFYGTV